MNTENTERTERTTPQIIKQKGKEDTIVVEAVVNEALKGNFRVEMVQEKKDKDSKPHIILAHLAGKLRKNRIKVVPGDRVQVEISPYDLTRGRIIYRMKG